MDLIHRTKAAVRELDNLNYRKMKKILMVDSQENEVSTGEPEEDSTVSTCKIIFRRSTSEQNARILCFISLF